MRKIVEYDSKMNSLSFGKFKEKELDLFFSICYKLKNEGVNEIVLSFQELKELSNYSRNDIKRFTKDLESTYTKLLDIKFEIILSPGVKEKFVLFTSYRIDETQKEIKIRLNQDYSFILNDIEKFTKFDLMEFASLKSAYAKNMFRLLKQFDNNELKEKWFQIKLDDFKVMLDIPKSYKMVDIDKRVLSPIQEQLKLYFQGLKLEKIKKGVKVESLKFTWKTKKKKQVEEIQAIKKRSSIGEKELEEYQEQFQEIKKEINSMDQVKKIDKIKISKVDYENLYKKYLEENNIKHIISVRKIFDTMNKSKYEIVEFGTKEYIQTKIYTVEDIDESLLVSKNGRKLVGMAKQHKIKKILEEMNS
ncbi:replication initiation protein [Cetobacterium sp.]|uniref:replication initiation protein n=1 Tax=Cetobacterium sp. TaxID=2071632 RepID=UPI003EE50C40